MEKLSVCQNFSRILKSLWTLGLLSLASSQLRTCRVSIDLIWILACTIDISIPRSVNDCSLSRRDFLVRICFHLLSYSMRVTHINDCLAIVSKLLLLSQNYFEQIDDTSRIFECERTSFTCIVLGEIFVFWGSQMIPTTRYETSSDKDWVGKNLLFPVSCWVTISLFFSNTCFSILQ